MTYKYIIGSALLSHYMTSNTTIKFETTEYSVILCLQCYDTEVLNWTYFRNSVISIAESRDYKAFQHTWVPCSIQTWSAGDQMPTISRAKV